MREITDSLICTCKWLVFGRWKWKASRKLFLERFACGGDCLSRPGPSSQVAPRAFYLLSTASSKSHCLVCSQSSPRCESSWMNHMNWHSESIPISSLHPFLLQFELFLALYFVFLCLYSYLPRKKRTGLFCKTPKCHCCWSCIIRKSVSTKTSIKRAKL